MEQSLQAYYYLNVLESCPFKLSLLDVLHLGATGTLPLYVFVSKSTLMENLTTFERHIDDGMYLQIPLQTIATMEKDTTRKHTPMHAVFGYSSEASSIYPLEFAGIDERYKGATSAKNPFIEQPNKVFNIHLDENLDNYNATPFEPADRIPQISIAELLCWTEDLENLAKQGSIQLLNTEHTSHTDTDRMEYPPHLEALILAWRRNWKNADRTDRSACPKKADVKGWLTDQGLSAKNADAGATIIKPQWASDKGW